jgi:DNA or RNA helicases of superfamily II
MDVPTKLITNSNGQTFLYELQQAFSKCRRFYFSVAFINYSGLQLLLDNLKDMRDRGVHGKIMTSTYLNFTEPKALKKIKKFDNVELKVFEADRTKGFHSKAYIFENDDDYTIMIGSSNITQSALKSNVEWNIEIVSKDEDALVQRIRKEYRELWDQCAVADDLFLQHYQKFIENLRSHSAHVSEPSFSYGDAAMQQIVPNLMQRQAIENLERLRNHGEQRALVISATGTGKTYMAAFDVRQLHPATLLYIVHREEILVKAKETFESLLGRGNMGLFTGNEKDYSGKKYIFTTIQTIKDHYQEFSPDYFKYMIIDEAHHATSPSYSKVLDYFKPDFLLGMTATPERCDNGDIFGLFDNNIAVEVRLNEALEEDLVLPFHYFGITDVDGIDLSDISIDDVAEVAKRLKINRRVDFIVKKMNFYGYDGESCKCLGYCVTKDHAQYMADEFNKRGINSACLTGDDPQSKRQEMIHRLEDDFDPLQVIFTVDIFNEGVDIPSVNLVLMLRPTNSPIIFMQQLGRGLRKYQGQSFLTVLDFIGNHSKTFLIAIALSGKRFYDKDSLKVAVKRGFPDLPGATHIQMDKISQQQIIKQLDMENFRTMKYLKDEYLEFKKEYVRATKRDIPYYLMDYVKFENAPDPVTFIDNKKSYLEFLAAVEKTNELKRLANTEPFCQLLRQLSAFLPIKRPHEFIILRYLVTHDAITREIAENELLKMMDSVTGETLLHAFERLNQTYDDHSQIARDIKLCTLDGSNNQLIRSPLFGKITYDKKQQAYILDVLNYGLYRYGRQFGSKNYGVPFLKLYEQYASRDLGPLINFKKKLSAFRGSTIPNGNDYYLFIDLNKDEESIKYKDKFISSKVFQWETPNATSQETKQGQRLVHNKKYGINLYLFVRKFKVIDNSTEPYIYIGKGDVTSFHGNKPITTEITLNHEIPMSLYLEFTTEV